MFGYFASWGHVDKLEHLPLLRGLGEIRLLEPITASSGRLFNVPRNSAPKYFALSYAWGDPTPVAPYTVGRQKILIPKSLSQALARVYKYISESSGKEVYIWADALCINQNDNDEKAAQVAIMDSIYQKAASVLVYLGEDGYGDDSKSAITTISSWGYDRSDPEFDVIFWLRSSSRHLNPYKFLSLSNNPALNSFFSRPWWNRMWTIQEVSNRGHIVVLSGAHEIQWNTLIKAVELWLDHEAIYDRIGSIHQDAVSGFLVGGLAAKAVIQSSRRSGELNWFSVLAATANFAASDPRDKIYALFSICPVLPGFEISYQKSAPQVFREFTSAMIKHHKNLEILQLAGLNHDSSANQLDLPSWIPNFEKLDHPILPYRNMLCTKHFSQHISNAFKVWNASPYPYSLEPATSTSDLRPKGIQIGMIDNVLPPRPGAQSDPGWLRTAYRRFGAEYNTPTLQCHILQAYFRTVMGDYYVNTNQKLLSYPGKFTLAGTFWHKCRNSMASLLQNMDLSGGLDEILLGQSGELLVQFGRHDHDVSQSILDKFGSLHFFLTSNGYMGYGPSCQPGDVVCIIFGCSVPLVLRPEGEGHVILGQCFVLGVMDGEMFKDGPSDPELVEGVQVFDIL